MENIVELICEGELLFTAPVVVRLLLFSLVLECIGTIAYAIASIGRR